MPTRLGQLAEQNHWTPHDGVRQFEQTARKLGEPTVRTISARQWERWCAGNVKSRPQPAACRILEAMTGYPIDELLSVIETPVGPPVSDDTIDPKGLLTMAAQKARDWIAVVEASNVGPEILAQLRDELAMLARSYPREALSGFLPDLVNLQNVIFRLLDGKHTPNASRDLYLYAGMSSGLVAKASHDLGNPRSALTHARLAYVCASHAGHTGLGAWVRGLQSLIAYWADWPQDALRYARTGIQEAGGLASTTAAWLASLEARALARLGMPIEARHALDHARSLREHVRSDELDELGGLLTFTAPRQLYYRADTWVFLPGDTAEAEQEAMEAVASYDQASEADASFSDLAGARADLALARVRLGHVEGAHDALRPTLDLSPAQRIGGIMPSVQRVSEAIRVPALNESPVIRALREEIESFTRNRASVLPQ